jgi:chitin disaccharide deacetylase
VNADDFGLSPGVNDGILEAHAAGVVSSVSVLVNAPGWEHAVAALRGTASTLGVGLHLNLTAGEPLSGGRSLVHPRTGRFYGLAGLVTRALTGRIDPDHVAEEGSAQLGRLRAAGVRVTHIDSHRHVHALPGVWAPVVATARAHGVPFVRVPVERGTGRAWVKRWTVAAAWRVAARAVGAPRHADRFCGIGLQGDPRFLGRVLALIDRLAPSAGVTELMVHPGRPDRELAAWDGYVAPRAAELAALTSSAARERLRRGDVGLTHFGAV